MARGGGQATHVAASAAAAAERLNYRNALRVGVELFRRAASSSHFGGMYSRAIALRLYPELLGYDARSNCPVPRLSARPPLVNSRVKQNSTNGPTIYLTLGRRVSNLTEICVLHSVLLLTCRSK